MAADYARKQAEKEKSLLPEGKVAMPLNDFTPYLASCKLIANIICGCVWSHFALSGGLITGCQVGSYISCNVSLCFISCSEAYNHVYAPFLLSITLILVAK